LSVGAGVCFAVAATATDAATGITSAALNGVVGLLPEHEKRRGDQRTVELLQLCRFIAATTSPSPITAACPADHILSRRLHQIS
jgi:hypothetical protein